MTAGTGTGTTGKADGVRDLQGDDQFAISSISKSLVAAQVMLMVDDGELGLDDPPSLTAFAQPALTGTFLEVRPTAALRAVRA